MKSIQIIVIRLLLFFYIISSYLSATHIHNNIIEKHVDCKVCIIVKNLHNVDTPNLDINYFPYQCYYPIIYFQNTQTIRTIKKGFNSNAPPKFS